MYEQIKIKIKHGHKKLKRENPGKKVLQVFIELIEIRSKESVLISLFDYLFYLNLCPFPSHR